MAELAQDRARVLADERRRTGDAAGRLGELDELAELAHVAEQRVRVARDQAELDVVGVEQRRLAAVGVDAEPRSGTPASSRVRVQKLAVLVRKRGSRIDLELAPVLGAARGGREARVVDDLGDAEHACTARRNSSSVTAATQIQSSSWVR